MSRQAERLLRALVFLSEPMTKLGLDQNTSKGQHTELPDLIRIESHDNQWRAA
jgi:hypothetical protein